MANEFKIAFFGDSIMEHYTAHADELYDQLNLPKIGSQVLISEWRKMGYPFLLESFFKIKYFGRDVIVENNAYGGATSRRVLDEVEKKVAEGAKYDVVFVGVGLNDIWRKYQSRTDEAVAIERYADFYSKIITGLKSCSDNVIAISATPVDITDKDEINADVMAYNNKAREITHSKNCAYIDVFTPFYNFVQLGKATNLWSDGLHMSQFGDALMFETIREYLVQNNIFKF